MACLWLSLVNFQMQPLIPNSCMTLTFASFSPCFMVLTVDLEMFHNFGSSCPAADGLRASGLGIQYCHN